MKRPKSTRIGKLTALAVTAIRIIKGHPDMTLAIISVEPPKELPGMACIKVAELGPPSILLECYQSCRASLAKELNQL
jgi:hypothetical protein